MAAGKATKAAREKSHSGSCAAARFPATITSPASFQEPEFPEAGYSLEHSGTSLTLLNNPELFLFFQEL